MFIAPGFILRTLVGALLVGASGVAVAQADVVEVTTIGRGVTLEAARRDAFRNALEEGGKVTFSAHRDTEYFELVRETVHSKAQNFVSRMKILEEGAAVGGVFSCRVRASVNKTLIASTWAEAKRAFDKTGTPGIALFVRERIEDSVQQDSILESRLEQRLRETGFAVYSGSRIRALAQEASASETDLGKLLGIARRLGAVILIEGLAQASGAGLRELDDHPTAMYDCSARIRMYYTDTGQMIGREALSNTRDAVQGEHELSPQAARKALSVAGESFIDKCYLTVMRRWARAENGDGEIALEISGLRPATVMMLKKKFLAIDPATIRQVSQSNGNGIVTYSFKTTMTGQELAKHLARPGFASIFEVLDVSSRRIRAKRAGS